MEEQLGSKEKSKAPDYEQHQQNYYGQQQGGLQNLAAQPHSGGFNLSGTPRSNSWNQGATNHNQQQGNWSHGLTANHQGQEQGGWQSYQTNPSATIRQYPQPTWTGQPIGNPHGDQPAPPRYDPPQPIRQPVPLQPPRTIPNEAGGVSTMDQYAPAPAPRVNDGSWVTDSGRRVWGGNRDQFRAPPPIQRRR